MKFDAPCSLPAHGISRALSCRSIRARAIARSHGWRRLVTGRSVDRCATRSAGEFTLGGVVLESLRVGRHESSNHRVEVNRHQPPCLPNRFDSVIATVQSHVDGQVAVTHPGRST